MIAWFFAYSVGMRSSMSSTILSHNVQDFILPLAVYKMVIRHTPVVEAKVKWSVFGPKTVKVGTNYIIVYIWYIIYKNMHQNFNIL